MEGNEGARGTAPATPPNENPAGKLLNPPVDPAALASPPAAAATGKSGRAGAPPRGRAAAAGNTEGPLGGNTLAGAAAPDALAAASPGVGSRRAGPGGPPAMRITSNGFRMSPLTALAAAEAAPTSAMTTSALPFLRFLAAAEAPLSRMITSAIGPNVSKLDRRSEALVH